MADLQALIHKWEEGEGATWLKRGMAILLLLVIAVIYDVRVAQNYFNEEAMDMAQLGRNISEGKGYTTQFIRPFDLYLLNRHSKGVYLANRQNGSPLDRHPDLSNPPVYPLILAGLMKVLPFNYTIVEMEKARFSRYQPEVIILIFNQFLFLINGVLLFQMCRKLFSDQIAWFTAIIFVGSELLWKFSASGLSNHLAITFSLGLAWALIKFDIERDSVTARPRRLLVWAGIAGATLGLMCLTRYSLGLLIIPAVGFLFLRPGFKSGPALTCLVIFFLMICPWMVRNVLLTGMPFGTATYAIQVGAGYFNGRDLERSLDASFGLQQISFSGVAIKLINGCRESFDLSIFGAGWLGAFFLTGIMVRFKTAGLNRLRNFVLSGVIVLFVAQIIFRTHLSVEVPHVNSENLLIVLTPMIMMFGVAFYFILLDQVVVPFQQLKIIINGVFLFLVCSGLFFRLLPPRNYPVNYPPYHPPFFQQVSGWFGDKDLIITDLPWAIAWYGNRLSILLTGSQVTAGAAPERVPGKDFYTLNDDIKTVSGMILSTRFMDSPMGSKILEDRRGWGRLVAESLTKGDIPKGFPLRNARADFLPSHFLLMDWERWRVKKNP